MKTYQKLTLSALALCISQQLYAETTTNIQAEEIPTATLKTIVIKTDAKTGTALAQKISEMPAVTQVIGKEEIAEQATGNRTIGDILGQLIPSLGTGSGSTSNYATTMRGRPLQYLLNGVPLTGSRNISRQLNSIDPTQLERVEVLSGATSIYGSGATGGLINLVTKSASDEYGLRGESRIGISSNRNFDSESFGYNVGQSVSFANDTVYGGIDVDYETKGGKFDSSDKRISPDINQTDQQDTKTLSVNANLGFDLTDSQSVNLSATHYNNQQDTDYGADYSPNIVKVLTGQVKPTLKAVKGFTADNQPQTTANSVSLNYNHDDVMGSNLSVTGYYRDEQGSFYPRATLVGTKGVVLQSEADINVKGASLAMQTPFALSGDREVLLSYGADYEKEHDEQTYYGHNLNTFLASNGLKVERNGKEYAGGPKTDITKAGAFVNADVDVTDKLHASAGVRHQKIKAKTDAFVTRNDKIKEELFGAPATEVVAGEAENDATLFNVGASYQINPTHQVFVNFSQGFAFSDVFRGLRDVKSDFVLTDDSVKPVSVDSYALGWNIESANTQANLTGFYNTSDKTVKFNKHKVEVLDNDERVYGAEASVSHKLDDNWTVGSSLAYTSGQYKDSKSGDWIELDATRITPLKGTAFAQYNFEGGSNIRLQATAIDGTDKAHKDNQTLAKADRIQKANPVKGYVTADLVGQVNLKKGHINYGIYNLTNTDYKTVYHQSTYGEMNRLNAKGTNYGLSYTIEY